MDRVLGTVELLELILSQVDLNSILISGTRVCRQWNHVIRASPELQTLLFFKSDTAKDGQSPPATRTNPLLLRHFGGRLISTFEVAHHSGTSTTTDSLHDIEPSWRRMLMQQPATRKVGIWIVEMGRSFQHGFMNTTEIFDVGEKGNLSLVTLAASMDHLGQGSPWTLYWGAEGKKFLEAEKTSLFVLKARASERASLLTMWQTVDVVVKFTRWTSAE